MRLFRQADKTALAGSAIAAAGHPIAAMHCRVIVLQGVEPCIAPSVMPSQQSIVAIAVIMASWTRTGLIAIADDCPIRPAIAISSRLGRKKRDTSMGH